MSKRKGIRMILDLPYLDHIFFWPLDKIYLMLVYLGVKPCTFFVFEARYLESAVFYHALESFYQKLNQLGLFCSLGTHYLGFTEPLYLLLWVAKKPKILRKALMAKTEKEVGLVLGFPKTAVKAYCQEKGFTRLSLEEEREKLPKKYENRFTLGFIMSKKNWRREIKTLEKWYQTIARQAPELLREWEEYQRKISKKLRPRIKSEVFFF